MWWWARTIHQPPPVTLNAPGVNPVTVNYATANGTTSSNTACQSTFYSYLGRSNSLTFVPGVTTQTIRIPLLNCGVSLTSGFEEFALNLSGNSSDSTIVRDSTQIDITGDASATATPPLSVLDATVDATAGTINVPVLLGGPSGAASGLTVSVPYSTHGSSAMLRTDPPPPTGRSPSSVRPPRTSGYRSGPHRRSGPATLITLGTPPTPPSPTLRHRDHRSQQRQRQRDRRVSRSLMWWWAPRTVTSTCRSPSTPRRQPRSDRYATANETTSSNTACQSTIYGYLGRSNSLAVPGVTTQTIRIPLLSRVSLTSGFEEFALNLSGNSSDSTIVRDSTQIDITGDASATATPPLSVLDATVDATAGTINVPVLLGGPSGAASGLTVSVPYTTHDGTAVAGTDYTTTSGTLSFPAGETARTSGYRSWTAPAQRTRSFSITLGTPTNATIADGTAIVTIGASGASAVTAPKISAPPNTAAGAGNGYIDLPVTLSAPGVNTVTVNYATANGTTSSNTACQSTIYSYLGRSNSLTFVPGVTTQTIRIPLLNCGQTVNGTFLLNLSGNSSNSTIARASATITVVAKVTHPGAPQKVTAVAGNGAATVSFAAPGFNGGSAIIYTVTASPGGATATGISSPITVSGLTNGISYTFTMTATNAAGKGPASPPSNSVTPS